MFIVESILGVGGLILALVGAIMILIPAFKESIWWGLGAIFIPLVLPIFAFMHWDTCKKGFGVWIAGVLFYLGSIIFFVEESAMGNLGN